MKKLITLVAALASATAVFAQQNTPVSSISKSSPGVQATKVEKTVTTVINKPTQKLKDSASATAAKDTSSQTVEVKTTFLDSIPPYKPSRFEVFAIGDVSSQTTSQVNAAGKLAFYVKPWSTFFCIRDRVDPKATVEANRNRASHKTNKELMTSMFLSFNVNASNKDSATEKIILFSDLGKSSVLFTPEIGIYVHTPDTNGNKGWSYYYGIMTEFSNKTVVGNKAIDGKDTSVYFNVNSFTLGLKGTIYFHPSDDYMLSVSGIVYYNYIHIPDKDKSDFTYILRQENLANSFNSIGVKLSVGINNFQIYADAKHTNYDFHGPILDRGLTSTNINVGVIMPISLKRF